MITVKVDGLNTLIGRLLGASKKMREELRLAGLEVSENILETPGIRTYPPETKANRPPTPYYVRHVGMQYKYGNNGKSQRLGSNWKVASAYGKIEISNKATYAQYINGDKQVKWAGARGWRKITDVLKQKAASIRETYIKHIRRAFGGLMR